MSILHITRCFYTPTLKPNQRLIAISLADYADDHGRAFPSLRDIAAKTGYSRRQTQRIVGELEKVGYVEILIPATWNRTPLYQLHPEILVPYERYEEPPLPLPPQDLVREYLEPEKRGNPREETDKTADLNPQVGGEDNLTPREDTSGTQEMTNDAGGEDTGVTRNRHRTVIEPSEDIGDDVSRETSHPENGQIVRFEDETVPDRAPRPRNRAWDALTAIFEYEPEGTEAALWGKLSRAAHESAYEASGDPGLEVMVRADRLLRQWGAKALTPPSLLKHWKRFGSKLGAVTDEEVERVRSAWEQAARRERLAALETRELEEGS